MFRGAIWTDAGTPCAHIAELLTAEVATWGTRGRGDGPYVSNGGTEIWTAMPESVAPAINGAGSSGIVGTFHVSWQRVLATPRTDGSSRYADGECASHRTTGCGTRLNGLVGCSCVRGG